MVLQGLVDQVNELGLSDRTGNLVDNVSTLEQNQGRDGPDTEFTWCGRIVIHIHFGDLDLTVKLLGQFINDRPDGLARATPGGPEVNQAGQGVADHGGVEITITYMKYFVACHPLILLLRPNIARVRISERRKNSGYGGRDPVRGSTSMG